jgi:hypothetical protein
LIAESFFSADQRKNKLIYLRYFSVFICVKLFFHADQRRKEPLIYLWNLPDPQQRIRRKEPLTFSFDLRDFSVLICVSLFSR